MTRHRDDDVLWAKTALRDADPLDHAARGQIVAEVRHDLGAQIGGERPRRRPLARLLAAAAASLALVAALPLLTGSRPAWAVEPVDAHVVRVELAEIYGIGPDPAGLVAALRAAGVDARTSYDTTWWPLLFGRVRGLHTRWSPDACGVEVDFNAAQLPDQARFGIVRQHGVNGFLLDTARFADCDGTVTVMVGQPPWK